MKIEQGIVHPAHSPQGLEQLAQPAVHQGHGAGIRASQTEQLSLAQNVTHGAGGNVDQHRNILDVDLLVDIGRFLDQVALLTSLELVRIDGGVLVAIGLGRVPRSVRAEQVEPEQERVGPAGSTLEPVDGRPHRPGNSRVLLEVCTQHGPVPEELLPALLPEPLVRVVVGRKPQTRLVTQLNLPGPGVVGGNQRVISLSAHPEHVVEPAAVAQTGLAQQGNIRDQCGAHALVPEQVGQDQLVAAQRRPTLLRVGKAVPPRPPASPRGQRGQVFGKVMIEDGPLRRQAVEVGRLDPGVAVSTQEPQVQAVADHDDDVHGPHCNQAAPGVQR